MPVLTRSLTPRISRPTSIFALLALVVALSALSAVRAEPGLGQGLESVRDHEAEVSAQIAEQNRQINALIGELATAREREGQAAEELAAEQQKLDQATAELADNRQHLRAVRVELKKAIDSLERLLLVTYKSNRPDEISMILGADTFDEMLAQAEYTDRINEYEAAVVNRVQMLREEVAATVERLATQRAAIADARDAAAERHSELASISAGLESSQATMAAARDQRKDVLSGLRGREADLIDQLTVTPSTPTTDASPDAVATTPAPAPAPPPAAGDSAVLGADGQAIAPANAPQAVKDVIASANAIATTPYIWGGGHASFESSGYDCSGGVSYALHGGGFLSSPLDSTGLSFWGEAGVGQWITVYANSGHVWAVIAGLRWDTSGGAGPRWHSDMASTSGFVVRHPSGY